jgi:hypothetical protein
MGSMMYSVGWRWCSWRETTFRFLGCGSPYVGAVSASCARFMPTNAPTLLALEGESIIPGICCVLSRICAKGDVVGRICAREVGCELSVSKSAAGGTMESHRLRKCALVM